VPIDRFLVVRWWRKSHNSRNRLSVREWLITDIKKSFNAYKLELIDSSIITFVRVFSVTYNKVIDVDLSF